MAGAASKSPDEIKIFNPKDQPFGELSNNARDFLTIGAQRWPTVTNFTYAMLLTNPLSRKLVQEAPFRNVQRDFRTYLRRAMDDATSKALTTAYSIELGMSKESSQKLMQLLLSTGNRPIHYMSSDYITGVGKDNNGKNMVGRTLMEIRHREQLKQAQEDAQVASSQQNDRVYNAYMATQALKYALNEEQDPTLSKYKDMAPEDVVALVGIDNLPPVDREAVLAMYRRGALTRGIDYSLKNLNSNALISAVRKDELRGFALGQEVRRKAAVTDIYADSILRVDYEELPLNEYQKAREQQFTQIGYHTLSQLRKDVWDLYESRKFEPGLQQEMDEAVAAIKVPSAEEIELAEATIHHPEVAAPTSDVPPALEQTKQKKNLYELHGISFEDIKSDSPDSTPTGPRPIKKTVRRHTTRDSLVSNLKMYEAQLENEDLEGPQREEARKQVEGLKRAIDRMDGIEDEDVLTNIQTLKARQETYLKASLSRSLDSKTREHSRKEIQDLQDKIDLAYASLDEYSLEKERNKLMKEARTLKASLEAAKQSGEKKRVDELLVRITSAEESARRIQDHIRKSETARDDIKKAKEEQKRREEQSKQDKAKAKGESSAKETEPDFYAVQPGQLAMESKNAIKIYPRPCKGHDSPYQELSPLRAFMLAVGGRTYPTVMHYVMVSRLADLPLIPEDTGDIKSFEVMTGDVKALTFRNAYPYICKDPARCKSTDPDIAFSENPLDFKDIRSIETEYRALQNRAHDVLLVKNAQVAMDVKFESRRLQDLLLMTKDAYLVWDDQKDPVLGVGPSKDGKPGTGQNAVGKYLMEIRARVASQRDKDDIHLLTENDVAEILVDDEFLNGWLKMRIRDMCRAINVVRSYLFLKNDANPPLTAKLVEAILNEVYQPCSHLYGLSDLVQIAPPDYFRRIIMSCPGFQQKLKGGGEYGEDEEEADEWMLDDDAFAAELEAALDEPETVVPTAGEQTLTDKNGDDTVPSGQPQQARLDPVIDLIWRRIAVMIYMIIKSLDRPSLMNARNIIAKSTLLLAAKSECVQVVPDREMNCVVSALLNVIRGLHQFNEYMQYNPRITKQDVEAAASIILDRDVLDEIEPQQEFGDEQFDETEGFVNEQGDDILYAQTTTKSEIRPATGRVRDIDAINKILKQEFEGDIEDSEEISALIMGAAETIQTFPAAENVKQGRINFFATLR